MNDNTNRGGKPQKTMSAEQLRRFEVKMQKLRNNTHGCKYYCYQATLNRIEKDIADGILSVGRVEDLDPKTLDKYKNSPGLPCDIHTPCPYAELDDVRPNRGKLSGYEVWADDTNINSNIKRLLREINHAKRQKEA